MLSGVVWSGFVEGEAFEGIGSAKTGSEVEIVEKKLAKSKLKTSNRLANFVWTFFI